MANNHDARPFIDLQKDAEEFQAKFEEDIEKCKSILDAKITDLICDPDSLGNSIGPKQNALVEFSKAKYDIYISMKSLMNDMEREWLKYISEMKKLFIDNVEVFLANTKLEVKLPSSEYHSSPGFKKSPGTKRSTAVTATFCPVISSITKNIPVFLQKNNSPNLEMETDEAETDFNASRSSSRSRKSIKWDNPSVAPLDIIDVSDDNEDSNEHKQNILEPIPKQYGRKGRYAACNRKVKEMTPKNVSSSESEEETSESESGLAFANSRKSTYKSSSRSKSASILKEGRFNTYDEGQEIKETDTKMNTSSLKVYKRRQASQSQADTKSNISRPRGRPSRRKTVNETVIERETSVSPKTVTLTADYEEFDLETPVTKRSETVARRKTLIPKLDDVISGLDTPGKYTSARSKRKTISAVPDLASVTPSKRLKNSYTQKRNTTSEMGESGVTEHNLLEIGDNYSPWISLKSIDGKIPANPAIYEVKVWRAKKSAYIGFCDSLRHKLTLHKLKQNSGHKHLDKFIERNYDDIQIKYEVVSSANDAKVEVKNRVNNFVALHKTTPAYN